MLTLYLSSVSAASQTLIRFFHIRSYYVALLLVDRLVVVMSELFSIKVLINTLGTGDADLRFCVINVKDG
jgi:hypothetical protein